MPEYGNPEIKHNVEYSLHPILWQSPLLLQNPKFPVTAARIIAGLGLRMKVLTHTRCTMDDALRAVDTGVSGIDSASPSAKVEANPIPPCM